MIIAERLLFLQSEYGVSELHGHILNGIAATDFVTWIATITAIIYVILSLRLNVWCWIFGIISSGLSVSIYMSSDLPYEAVLNVVYVILGVYGWRSWSVTKNRNEKNEVRRTGVRLWLIIFVAGTVGGIILGKISRHYTISAFPYTDALIATFSIIATWLSAKKYLSNWIIWILADGASTVIYFLKGPQLYLFGLLFIFYTFMAVAGYISWKKRIQS